MKNILLCVRASLIPERYRYPGSTVTNCEKCLVERILVAPDGRVRALAGEVELLCVVCATKGSPKIVIEPKVVRDALAHFERVQKENVQ